MSQIYHGESMQKLKEVIAIDPEKCVNCHHCIAVCPVKFCNDASGEHVDINSDMCIGCGECLKVCTHGARLIRDDLDFFLSDLDKKEPMIAIVAPAVAAELPDNYLRLNGWLKHVGIEAIFDVSFGAELTVKSYLEYIKEASPKTVISQPCPAIVTYIEIYRPELIPYLAPADSPMLHTIRMVREFYPKYRNYKVVVISPCIAKRREFDEVGLGNYNVTMQNLLEYLNEEGIQIDRYPEVDFDNNPAERAVLFSSPGGLLQTALREMPSIGEKTRQIEGPENIYHYLDDLPAQIDLNHAPLLIDCLNCSKGCNGGTGTGNQGVHRDQLDYYSHERRKKMQEIYKTEGQLGETASLRKMRKSINQFWKKGMYERRYVDLSSNFVLNIPSEKEIQDIYLDMGKRKKEDFLNCSSCGYGSCEKMAVAIFNGLNRKENCHHYLQKSNTEKEEKELFFELINRGIHSISSSCEDISENVSGFREQIVNQSEISESVLNEMTQSLEVIDHLMENVRDDVTEKLVRLSENGVQKIRNLGMIMTDITKISDEMRNMTIVIEQISERTNMLALNAGIQAAHAGEYGKAFAVVAGEIKDLAGTTALNVEKISRSLEDTNLRVIHAAAITGESEGLFHEIALEVDSVDQVMGTVATSMEDFQKMSKAVLLDQQKLSSANQSIRDGAGKVQGEVEKIAQSVIHLKKMTEDGMDSEK